MKVFAREGLRRLRQFACVAVACMAAPAIAAEPTVEPLLRVETGMHTAEVFRIATDAAGRWAVTGSDDKTARVWDVATGAPLAVLRPPQGADAEGKVFAVAMTPDGSTVAVSGRTRVAPGAGIDILLFDRITGRLERRIRGLPERVHHLSYSADGRLLAASLSPPHGVRVFDAASGALVGQDGSYGSSSTSHHFSPDGRHLATTCYDGRVRLYDVDARGGLRLVRSARSAGGNRPHVVRFSPDGTRLAVAFEDTASVQILDSTTLAESARPAVDGLSGGNLALAWSHDGLALVAGCRSRDGGFNTVRRWEAKDWSRHDDQPVGRGTIVQLRELPEAAGGGWLFVEFGPAWGVLDARAAVRRRIAAPIADFRGAPGAFQLSANGQLVRFGYAPRDDDGRLYDPSRRTLLDAGPTAPAPPRPVFSPRTEAAGLAITDWSFSEAPKLNGRPLSLEPLERSRSAAIAPDAQHVVLGADWTLRLFDRSGRLVWRQPAPDMAWAVAISADNRFVVAGYADGTVRWHRMKDGSEVLALFPHGDRQRWVAWTPEGYFDASPGAEDLIGFHLNQGADREGVFVGARQLWETFYQPALIARRLEPDGDRLLAQQVQRRGDARRLLTSATIPEIALESPAVSESDGSPVITLRLLNLGDGGGRLMLRVDGQELTGRWNAPALAPGRQVALPLDLAEGTHRVSVAWVDGRGIASRPVEAQVTVRAGKEMSQPTLHLLAVGVSRYRDQALARGVAFAADDARAVGAEFERGARGLFQQVRSTVLTDEQGSRDGIEAAARAMAAAVKPADTAVIYLAGHGVTADGDYHFVTWETRYTNADALAAQSLSADRLRAMLAALGARKVLLLLDTCSAGRFSLVAGRAIDDKASIDRLQRATGRALIAATADEKMALEGEGRHGVFTFALLRALEGAADRDRDGIVTVSELAGYVDEQVPAITRRKWGYEQFPMLETRGSAFPLTRSRP